MAKSGNKGGGFGGRGGGRGQGNRGGWPSTTGRPSGGGRSYAPPRGNPSKGSSRGR